MQHFVYIYICVCVSNNYPQKPWYWMMILDVCVYSFCGAIWTYIDALEMLGEDAEQMGRDSSTRLGRCPTEFAMLDMLIK